jgi:hypothetical protein
MPALASEARPWKAAKATVPTSWGIAADDLAGRLALGDQGERRVERAVGGLAEAVGGARAVLAGEHQLEQRGVLGGEADVGAAEGEEAGVEARVRGGERAAQVVPEALEAVLGECVEQRLLAGEVAARRGVADADLTRELAQRQLAALVERLLGGLEQGGAEVAVVVGAGRDGHAGDPSGSCWR